MKIGSEREIKVLAAKYIALVGKGNEYEEFLREHTLDENLDDLKFKAREISLLNARCDLLNEIVHKKIVKSKFFHERVA